MISPAFWRISSSLAAALLACACGGSGDTEPAPQCSTNLDLTCAPLYTPTFDQVFTRTLQPTCAQAGGSCHSAEGAMGGLVFADPDAAYAALLGKSGAKPRVVAGDAACSLIVERLYADGAQVMPPGAPLADAERCAVVQWIQNGAKR
jgi:Planctomycete cytochrome C